MLDATTKRRIDTARDILVGKVPDPKSQVEQITIALIYKFMDDIDAGTEEDGGERSFFTGDFAGFGWSKLMDRRLGGHDTLNLYIESITKMSQNPGVPPLFRDIFNNAYLPYRDPETLRSFLRIIDEFSYEDSESLGDAFEYLLSVLDSQGDAGQFRTPRHIIDFIVAVVDPKKNESVLDPACGTAGFLISSFKHIMAANTGDDGQSRLTPQERGALAENFRGYDISPDMVRLSLVNMYLHGFVAPHIYEYDTLTSEDRWNEYADVILANPPFMSPKGGIRPHNRFSVQAKRSEVLFVDYMAEHLSPTGRAGIIVPEGIIFQSQNAHKQLRKMLVEEYLVAVVSLPAGVFQPYSGVKTSVLILDRALAKRADTIAFFKVENDGFDLGAQRRPVEGSHLPIVQAEIAEYMRRLREGECLDDFTPELGLIVDKTRISANSDYNLSGERYREKSTCSDWSMVELGNVCHVVNGSTPSRKEAKYWDNGTIPWFTVDDVRTNGRVISKTAQFVTERAIEETSLRLLPRNAVLLCCTASVGEYAFAEIELTTNQQFNGLVVKEGSYEHLLPKYLFHLCSQFKSELLRLSGKTSFDFVSSSTLKKINLPLPPLEVQQEIVAEIEGYQRVIDGARAVVENYRPHIVVDPEWPVVALGEVCKRIQYGLSAPLNTEKSGYKTFRMNELVDGRTVDRGSMKHAEISAQEFEKYRLTPGDILFNRTNSIEHVGRTGIFELEGFYCFASYLIRLSISQKTANPSYVNAFMNTDRFQSGIKQYASRAIGQSNINAKSLAAYCVPLPPVSVQNSVVSELVAERTLVEANRELIQRFEDKIHAAVGRVWGNVGGTGAVDKSRTG